MQDVLALGFSIASLSAVGFPHGFAISIQITPDEWSCLQTMGESLLLLVSRAEGLTGEKISVQVRPTNWCQHAFRSWGALKTMSWFWDEMWTWKHPHSFLS